jgi:hypothetical protein
VTVLVVGARHHRDLRKLGESGEKSARAWIFITMYSASAESDFATIIRDRTDRDTVLRDFKITDIRLVWRSA